MLHPPRTRRDGVNSSPRLRCVGPVEPTHRSPSGELPLSEGTNLLIEMLNAMANSAYVLCDGEKPLDRKTTLQTRHVVQKSTESMYSIDHGPSVADHATIDGAVVSFAVFPGLRHLRRPSVQTPIGEVGDLDRISDAIEEQALTRV